MKNKYLIPILGSIIILYWASYVPSLKPVPFINIQNEQESSSIVETNPRAEFDDFIKQENIKSWFTILVLIIGGIFSGLLILYRVKIGRFIAILFSLIVLIHMGWYYTGEVSFSFLSSAFKVEPLLVFRNEILRALICIATIVFLSIPSIKMQFNKRKP